ncbi:AraC family transcriptional regulator [Verrucomicrobia bacterium LW23]|nr:AraC family transcriptional regulator [Verrucomicrobia bacterium LW23]
MDPLHLYLSPPVRAENGGLFVSPGHGIHPDRVISSHELILVKSGTLHIAEESRVFAVAAGEILLLWPGRRHRGVRTYLPDLSFYWVHFQLNGAAPGLDNPAQHAQTQRFLPQHSRAPRADRLADLFQQLFEAQERDEPDSLIADLIVAQMLAESAPHGDSSHARHGERFSGATSLRRNDEALAGRAHRFVGENFARGLHAGDVARALGRNADYIGRVYKRVYGHTLSSAIHRRQVSHARMLLRSSYGTIEETALACGFREPRYFREVFAEHQGMSPSAYRRLYTRWRVNSG